MRERSCEDLFRQQAIESLAHKAPGRPICLMPRPWLWLSLLILLIFAIVLLFISTGEYARKETAEGWLVSDAGVVRVSTATAAVISEVAVAAGARVERGESLLVLSRDSHLSASQSTGDQLLRLLQLEKDELATQLDLSDEQLEYDSASYTKQLHDFDAEHQLQLAGVNAQKKRIAVSRQKLQRLQGLVGAGAVSDWDVILQQERVSELEQELFRLQQGTQRLQRDRNVLQARIDKLPATTKMQRSVLNARRRQLQQEITEHESMRTTIVASPVAGVVSSIQVHAGETAIAGQLLMTVLPEDTVLAAEVYVASRAVGFIRPGQAVRLAYAAFPQQKFGTFTGQVRHISDYVLLPRDIPQTFSVREATYRVEIDIDDAELINRIGSAVLRPGMLLTAEIILENRSLLEWFLEPLHLYRRAAG